MKLIISKQIIKVVTLGLQNSGIFSRLETFHGNKREYMGINGNKPKISKITGTVNLNVVENKILAA